MPLSPNELERAERLLRRTIAKRDAIVSQVNFLYDLAHKVQGDKEVLPLFRARQRDIDHFRTQFVVEQDPILDILIQLKRDEEYDKIHVPIGTSLSDSYYTIMAISDAVFDEPPVLPSTTVPNSAHIPLPKINLPTFDGSLLEWRSFRDVNVSLVHDNTGIGNAERFHYLLSCLSGSALSIIKSIPLSADNYVLAWDALSDRFDNKRLLVSAHLDKLFAFEPIGQESLPALIAFVNTFKENVSIIKSLGVDDLANFLLFYMGSRVLDSTTLSLFESSTSQSTIPNFDELMSFVQQRCKILENLTNSKKISRDDKLSEKTIIRGKFVKPTKSVFTATSTSVKSKTKNCLCCDKPDHRIYQCPKFAVMTVDKRRETVLSRKLCFACLSPTHMVNACSSTKVCHSCNSKRHNTLLYLEQNRTSTVANAVQNDASVSKSGPSTDSSCSFVGAARTNSTVVLGTAMVHIVDAWGQVHAVRALLDSGSQISAMTSECSARLGVSKRRYGSNIVGLAQSPVSQVHGVTSCKFSSHFKSDLFLTVDLVILAQITAAMPSTRLPASVRQKYQHLCLADKNFDIPSRIDVLFGADVLPSLVRPHAGVEHHSGFPSALDTLLGWIIFGSFSTPHTSSLVTLTTAVSPPSVGELLQKFWLVEEPVAPSSATTEDQWCEDFFKDSTFRDPTGRFCVALPFRHLFTGSVHQRATLCHGLGDSRSIALKRFHNLERRLNKNVELYAAYLSFMSAYQELGHMVPAPEPGLYFIPHHAVLKAEGDVSKIRVVFDASSTSSSGRSLNDILCTGPKLQTDLRDILLQCRMHRYILSADIVKMYRQILIRRQDRKFQHIFWRNAPEDDLIEFQLCTVTYGLNCAPYLAIRCLHELDAQDGDRFPLAKGILVRSAYVDDIVIGADTEELLLRRKQDIVDLLRSGACMLSKWTSNSAMVLESVSIEGPQYHSISLNITLHIIRPAGGFRREGAWPALGHKY